MDSLDSTREDLLDFRCYRKNMPTAVKASAIPTPGVNDFEHKFVRQGCRCDLHDGRLRVSSTVYWVF